MLYATFIMAIIASILFSMWLYRKYELIISRLLLSFVSLGSISMMFFMAAHTGVNIFLYIQSAFKGTFNYNFDAYSNIEFALLFFCIGFYIFRNVKAFATGKNKAAKKILPATVIQLILSGALIPVNTTSTIPTVLYSVSLIAFGIAQYRHKNFLRSTASLSNTTYSAQSNASVLR